MHNGIATLPDRNIILLSEASKHHAISNKTIHTWQKPNTYQIANAIITVLLIWKGSC